MSSSAHAGFDFNSNCQQAQIAILDLRTFEAREILSTERGAHPDNAYVYYLEHFADIVEIIVTDDEGLYARMMDTYPIHFESMDRIGGDSPFNKILQAEMLFYTGLAQLKYGSQVNAAAKVYSSYRQVRAHVQDHPEFGMNLKMAGMYNIMMDFIPKSLRWLTGMLGVRGDAEKGMEQLKQYLDIVKGVPGKAQEAVIIINLAYKLTWKDEEGLIFMEGLEEDLTDNVLANYVWAISATYCYNNALALEKLEAIDRSRLQVPFYILDYVKGRCKLNRLDPDANIPLERYLADYAGEDFKKDACIRLSFYYLLRGDVQRHEEYVSLARSTGHTLRERDQEAMKESESGTIPHAGLLKARLLFDGGYFEQADSVMNAIPLYTLNLLPYKLEFSYRRGRIDQVLGNLEMAKAALEKTYTNGKEHPYTFATRAALQLGIICEGQQDYPGALHWYSECLRSYDEKHSVSSVEDKAEKGKKRVLGRL